MSLSKVAKKVWMQAQAKQERGEIPAFTGVSGMLALMHQNITNWYTQQGSLKQEQVMDLCVHAIVALQLSMKEEEEKKEKPDYPIPASYLSPEEAQPQPNISNKIPEQPHQYDGWQFNAGKAAGLRQFLQSGGWWEQLEEHQREGIEDAIINGGNNGQEA